MKPRHIRAEIEEIKEWFKYTNVVLSKSRNEKPVFSNYIEKINEMANQKNKRLAELNKMLKRS